VEAIAQLPGEIIVSIDQGCGSQHPIDTGRHGIMGIGRKRLAAVQQQRNQQISASKPNAPARQMPVRHPDAQRLP